MSSSQVGGRIHSAEAESCNVKTILGTKQRSVIWKLPTKKKSCNEFFVLPTVTDLMAERLGAASGNVCCRRRVTRTMARGAQALHEPTPSRELMELMRLQHHDQNFARVLGHGLRVRVGEKLTGPSGGCAPGA